MHLTVLGALTGVLAALWVCDERVDASAPDGAGRSLTPHHVHAVRARARRLNAPDGAGRSLTSRPRCSRIRLACLNAPGGAGCPLTRVGDDPRSQGRPRLNAPDGAGRSLTRRTTSRRTARSCCLNGPDGAGCPLTGQPPDHARDPGAPGLNAPDGAGCSLTYGPPRPSSNATKSQCT